MYFLLHSNIMIVKGPKRSLLMDLQMENFTLIPNSLATFVKTCNKKEKSDIYQLFGASQRAVVDEYFEWLQNRDYLYWIEDAALLAQFPPLTVQWDSPFEITNLIVDVAGPVPYFDRILSGINDCNIPFLQIRLFEQANWTTILNDMLARTQGSALKGIEVAMEYQPDVDRAALQKLIQDNIRLYQFTFYGSPEEKVSVVRYHEYPVTLIYTQAFLQDHTGCGTIRAGQFRANMALYMESQQFNTCLNRKVAIDKAGEIRNCPSMPTSYGNIAGTSLAEAIGAPGFQDVWHVNKNQISVCKHCEFRHVCTDCRAYLQDPADPYSKPLKCGYNPVTNEWADWSTHPLSSMAITHYGLSVHHTGEPI
jgi:SPASM domain peptide maturase of grasp-with-spasm system